MVVGVSVGLVVGDSVGIVVGSSVFSVVTWLGVVLGSVFCVLFLPQAHKLSITTSTRSKDNAFFIVVPFLSVK